MLDFYNTKGGRKFIDNVIPRLVKSLEEIALHMNNNLEITSEEDKQCNICGARYNIKLLEKGDGFSHRYTICPYCGEI